MFSPRYDSNSSITPFSTTGVLQRLPAVAATEEGNGERKSAAAAIVSAVSSSSSKTAMHPNLITYEEAEKRADYAKKIETKDGKVLYAKYSHYIKGQHKQYSKEFDAFIIKLYKDNTFIDTEQNYFRKESASPENLKDNTFIGEIYCTNRPDYGCVEVLKIESQCRNGGYGKILMGLAEQTFARRKYATVKLIMQGIDSVSPEILRIIYSKLGFTDWLERGQQKDISSQVPVTEPFEDVYPELFSLDMHYSMARYNERKDVVERFILYSHIIENIMPRIKRSVQEGVDVDIPDRHGKTCLMIAAEFDKLDIANYLIEHARVDPLRKDYYGETAYDIAVKHKHDAVAEYLQKHMTSRKKVAISTMFSAATTSPAAPTTKTESEARRPEAPQ